jgi:murein DD-endopeptidase MepM/ murein hydrolase activator NlpD
MSTGILETIKQVALEVFLSKNPVKVLYGKVISTNPIQVQIDENLILDQNFLSVQGTVSEGSEVTVMRCQGGQKYIVFGVRTIDDITVNPNYGMSAEGSVVARGDWQLPYRGRFEVTSPYGEWRGNRPHKGVDLATTSGNKNVYAVNDGEVIFTGSDPDGYGNYVIISHGNKLWSLYAHFNKIYVKFGQKVDKNTIVGYEGSTGNSSGPHLHLELRHGANSSNNVVNPTEWLVGDPGRDGTVYGR